MSKILKTLTLAALLVAPGVAQAGGVAFQTPTPQELAVVKSVYADYVKSHPTGGLETANAAIDGSGNGALFVRFTDKGYCGPRGCYTVGLRYVGSTWRMVFDRSLTKLEITSMPRVAGHGDAAVLVVDGRERWVWSGARYKADVTSLGKAITASTPAGDEVGAAAQAAMASDKWLVRLLSDPSVGRNPIHYLQTAVDLGDLGSGYLAEATGAACGVDIGCPHFLFVHEGGRSKGPLKLVGTTYAADAVTVVPGGAVPDVAFSDSRGYHTLRWDGKAQFQQVATSYSSPLNPTP